MGCFFISFKEKNSPYNVELQEWLNVKIYLYLLVVERFSKSVAELQKGCIAVSTAVPILQWTGLLGSSVVQPTQYIPSPSFYKDHLEMLEGGSLPISKHNYWVIIGFHVDKATEVDFCRHSGNNLCCYFL